VNGVVIELNVVWTCTNHPRLYQKWIETEVGRGIGFEDSCRFSIISSKSHVSCLCNVRHCVPGLRSLESVDPQSSSFLMSRCPENRGFHRGRDGKGSYTQIYVYCYLSIYLSIYIVSYYIYIHYHYHIIIIILLLISIYYIHYKLCIYIYNHTCSNYMYIYIHIIWILLVIVISHVYNHLTDVESYLHFSVLYPMFILPDYIPCIIIFWIYLVIIWWSQQSCWSNSSWHPRTICHITYIYIYQQIWECTMKYHKCHDFSRNLLGMPQESQKC